MLDERGSFASGMSLASSPPPLSRSVRSLDEEGPPCCDPAERLQAGPAIHAADPDHTEIREAARRPRERPTLLIVDDEPDVLDSLRNLLRLDYRVVTRPTGAEALEFLRS